MQEFYANISLSNVAVDTVDTGEIDRSLPKASAGIVTDEQRKRALAFARFKAERVGVDLFEKRVCISCHDVRRSSSEPQGGASAMSWTVAPVHIAATWMPQGTLRPREAPDVAVQGLPPRRALAPARATSRSPTSRPAATAMPAARRSPARSCRRAFPATATTSSRPASQASRARTRRRSGSSGNDGVARILALAALARARGLRRWRGKRQRATPRPGSRTC